MEKSVKKWKVLKSEYLMKRPWMTVRRDAVQLPGGEIHDEHYVLEYPDWVNVIAVTKDGDYVMVEQYRHGLQEVAFELCAGVIEEGETPEEGARRELLEETGFGGGEWSLLTEICGNPSVTNNMTHCFLAKGVEKISEQHLDRTEDIKVHLVSREELLKLLLGDEMKQALMAAPLWKYFYLGK